MNTRKKWKFKIHTVSMFSPEWSDSSLVFCIFSGTFLGFILGVRNLKRILAWSKWTPRTLKFYRIANQMSLYEKHPCKKWFQDFSIFLPTLRSGVSVPMSICPSFFFFENWGIEILPYLPCFIDLGQFLVFKRIGLLKNLQNCYFRLIGSQEIHKTNVYCFFFYSTLCYYSL